MTVRFDTPPTNRRKRRGKVRGNAEAKINNSELVRERSELAAQNMCALGEMTGGIAHDFRNILSIVASGLRMAERSLDEQAGLKSALAAIQEGIARGERMTTRLLSFASQQELATSPEDVNALLRKLEPFIKYATDSGFRIELALAANLPACLVDPPRFNAAILNLVLNARDAMPEGGAIRISTTATRGTSFGQPCDYVRVRVRDHGTGMPSEILDQIFDPYFTTKGERGTGLGVPQVHALMKQVGGFVRVDSKVGEGTSFDLFFPFHADHPAASDAWRQLDRWADEGGAISGVPALSGATAPDQGARLCC
jgi:signal transduction histidine kinase